MDGLLLLVQSFPYIVPVRYLTEVNLLYFWLYTSLV